MIVGELTQVLLTYGNTHEILKNPKMSKSGYANKHHWVASIKPKEVRYRQIFDKLLEKVVFELDPGFAKPLRHVKPEQGECSLSINGWGDFTLEMHLKFKDYEKVCGGNITIYHELCFKNGGKFKEVAIEFDKKWLDEIMSK